MICPECGKLMRYVERKTPINYAAEIRWEKWYCNPCKLAAKVETVFSHDEPAVAVSTESAK